MTQERYADGSIKAHSFDALVNRTGNTIPDAGGDRTQSYANDNRIRLSRETKQKVVRLAYRYDAMGNNKTQLITTLVDGTSETIGYTYDELNRLASVTNDEGTCSDQVKLTIVLEEFSRFL